jgi:DNA-binding beta-propeller fold protein YncE
MNMNSLKCLSKALTLLATSALAWTSLAGCNTTAAAPAKYQVLQSLAVGGEGRWDYIAVDGVAGRLYVPRSTRVMVLDAKTGAVLGEVPGTSGVHGVAIVRDRNLGFASSGKDNSVTAFDLDTFKPVRTIKAGTSPDAILYDAASKRVFAFNHRSGDITIIDPAALDAPPVTLAVGGTLEYGATDNAGHVYVNVEDKAEVVAIDSLNPKVLAHWSVQPGESPTGLAIDAKRGVLFVGCQNKKLVMVDVKDGKILATVPVGEGVDGVAFDPGMNLAMTADGKDGTMTVVGPNRDGQYVVEQTLGTVVSARTIGLDTRSHRVYLPCMLDGKKFGIVVAGPVKQ